MQQPACADSHFGAGCGLSWAYGGCKNLAFGRIFLLQICLIDCNYSTLWRTDRKVLVPDYRNLTFYMEDFYLWQSKKSP